MNINIYLRDDVIHVKIVVATALMAIARKVIIRDYETATPDYVWATTGAVLAMGTAYWLVFRFTGREGGALPQNSPTSEATEVQPDIEENRVEPVS